MDEEFSQHGSVPLQPGYLSLAQHVVIQAIRLKPRQIFEIFRALKRIETGSTMSNLMNVKSTALVVSIAAALSTGVLAGTASADVEVVCNQYYCNSTNGKGTSVNRVDALRGELILGTTGFFEVFLPDGTKRTGPTNAERNHIFYINKSFNSGLICLRYFKRIRPGIFDEQGKAACTSIPID